MAVVETETRGQILVIRLNRPERLNALGAEMCEHMARIFSDYRDDDALEVAILTGTGRGFCAGEDMKESLERGRPGTAELRTQDPFWQRTLDKPVIGAINGFAMGGGFMLVERTDLRVAVKGALFEISEAKRWLLGGYDHGFVAGLPHPIATEMALGFRFTAERLHQVGFINRLVEPDELMSEAMGMAEHLLSLPPAARVNTFHMMRHMMPQVAPPLQRLAAALHEHGCLEDRMESRKAFAEKRKPVFKGWDDPADRHRLPTLDAVRGEDD
jgi:enoyl-CoA hydratase/carnithine racemase